MKSLKYLLIISALFCKPAYSAQSPSSGYICDMQSNASNPKTIEVRFFLYPETYEQTKQQIQVTLQNTLSSSGACKVLEEIRNYTVKAKEPFPGGSNVILTLSEEAPFNFMGRIGTFETGGIGVNSPTDSFTLWLNSSKNNDWDNTYNGICRFDSGLTADSCQ